MAYLLYKYREGGYSEWAIVDLGGYTTDAITNLLNAFLPNGRPVARINSMVAFETGVIQSDPLIFCIPSRFQRHHTIEFLRKVPLELVRTLVESWEKHDHPEWTKPAQEIRTRVLQLS